MTTMTAPRATALGLLGGRFTRPLAAVPAQFLATTSCGNPRPAGPLASFVRPPGRRRRYPPPDDGRDAQHQREAHGPPSVQDDAGPRRQGPDGGQREDQGLLSDEPDGRPGAEVGGLSIGSIQPAPHAPTHPLACSIRCCPWVRPFRSRPSSAARRR